MIWELRIFGISRYSYSLLCHRDRIFRLVVRIFENLFLEISKDNILIMNPIKVN